MASKSDRIAPMVSTRPVCPVCHHPVYASNGIHPQCAIRQSEPPRPKPKPPVPAPAVAVAAAAVGDAPAEAVRPAMRWGNRRI